MGLIRGAIVTLLTVLLFLTVLSTAVLMTVTLSLNYEYVNPQLTNVLDEQIRQNSSVGEDIDENLQNMQLYCQNESVFVKKIDENVFEIPCDVVNNGTEAILTYAINDLVEDNYYKEFGCSFQDCFNQEGDQPFFMFSKFSHDYWKAWAYKAFIASLVLVAVLFFFMEDRNALPFLVGIVSIVVSLPFLGIGKILSWVIGWEFLQFAQVLFTKAYTVFLVFFLVGIILIGLGIVLKFLSVGRWIGKLFGGGKKTKTVVKVVERESKKKKK